MPNVVSAPSGWGHDHIARWCSKLHEKVEDSVHPEPSLSPFEELPIIDDLLTSPSEKLPPSTSTSRHVPLSTAAVHEELSAQLAQMATQLTRNAIYFSVPWLKIKSLSRNPT